MYYVELDAKNLVNWFTANQQGARVLDNNTGYTLYFSDRRGEQNDTSAAPNIKTGSFGYNDIINPNDPNNGCSNLGLDPGEDFEGDGALRTYGGVETSPVMITPTNYMLLTRTGTRLPPPARYPVLQNPPCTTYYSFHCPGVTYGNTQEARENPPLFFRRALKIVNGITLNLGTSCYGTGTNPPCGLTVAAENPVYIQGDYNAPGGSLTGTGTVAAAVAGDAVTLLSDNWNDVNSFTDPYDYGARISVQPHSPSEPPAAAPTVSPSWPKTRFTSRAITTRRWTTEPGAASASRQQWKETR